MEKIFVDTSALVALFVKNDQNHAQANRTFEHIKATKIPLCTSDYIIDETITTILKRGTKDLSIKIGTVLMTSHLCTIIYVSPHHFKPAWDIYAQYTVKPFSFTDATSFAIMRALHISTAFAFDEDFTHAGFRLVQ